MQPTTIENTKSELIINKYPINLNSSEFRETVKEILAKHDISEIIETGTFNGLGSTRVFAETKKYVFTIECNYNNFVTSSQNLAQYENVCVVHGLSLKRDELIEELLHEKFDENIKMDSDYPKSFYMREIMQQVTVENALNLFANNDRKQLVFLDSAGGVGYAEYLKFMSFDENFLKNKILMLDDISHIKHSRSVKDLEIRGYIVHKSKEERFAWCDLSKK